jgi:hypothetical protein
MKKIILESLTLAGIFVLMFAILKVAEIYQMN